MDSKDNKEIESSSKKIENDINKLNLINEEEIVNEIKLFPYFLSEFSIILIILLIVFISSFIPQYHSSKIFYSKKLNSSFNPDYIPKILFHLSDIHVSNKRPSRTNNSYTFLKEFIKYEPDLILNTGDIVDNYEERKYQSLGSQWKPDWELYNKTVKQLLSKFPVIDVPGNHDLWALDSATSKHNLFLDYSFIYNRKNTKSNDDFIIRKIKMMNLTFILYNDYRFPTPPPPYGLDVHTNKNQLDLLENMIDNLEEEECYILSHYNVDRAIFTKSSKGHNFYDIISKKKVAALFTGHEHPDEVAIIHHGSEGGLEFCTSTPFGEHRSGLITIDNDNLIYNDIYIPSPYKRPLFIMTYPVPNDQISSHHIFNLNNFQIRVLSYIIDTNITLKVEGDIIGDLNYQMTLNNGAILYSLPVNLSNGFYKIHVYDENRNICDISRDFFIGDSYKGKKEKAIRNHRANLIMRFSAIPMVIFLFIIIFPFKYVKKSKLITSLYNYIEGNKYKYINPFSKYFLIILLSPFILRRRFMRLNCFCRYSIFIASLYPLILPVHIFNNIYGKIAFAFNVFIVIGNYIQYEHWAMEITYIYYMTIIIPNVLYLTSFKSNKIILFFNLFISYATIIGTIYLNFRSLAQSISFGYLFISPYIIILIIVKIIVHRFSYLDHNIENKSKNSIN